MNVKKSFPLTFYCNSFYSVTHCFQFFHFSMKHVYKQLYQITLLIIIDHQSAYTGNEIYSVAPGENKHQVKFMLDKQCEELALIPVLFPKGRYGYTSERKIKSTPTKYFNAWLLHRSGRFAEYLSFSQFIIEQKKISDSINREKSARSICNGFTNKIQCANSTESYLSRSGIKLCTFAINPWYPTILATIYV